MTESDLVATLLPVAEALDALGVRYFVGGSIASFAHESLAFMFPENYRLATR